MKKNIFYFFLAFLLNACHPLTEIISENYVVNKNFNLHIHNFSDVNNQGFAYFDGKIGKYVSLTISITNNASAKKELDFKTFAIDNTQMNLKIPLYSVAMAGTGWRIGGKNKNVTFNGGETKKLWIAFITPKEGRVTSLFYDNQKIELKYGKTKQVL